jgi:hypothetical protein
MYDHRIVDTYMLCLAYAAIPYMQCRCILQDRLLLAGQLLRLL